MPTTRSGAGASRGNASAHSEVIKMLKEDHKEAKKAFSDFEKLDVHEDSEECHALVEKTCNDLEAHAALEEELFYPAARVALDEEDLVDEAEVEHMTLRTLTEQLKDMAPEEEKFSATFKVLGEYAKHHIKEEEESLFPALARAKLDWERLLRQMQERREELMAQFASEPSTRKPPGAKGKAKPKEKAKGRRVPQNEEIEEVEEIADGGREDFPYVEPPDEQE